MSSISKIRGMIFPPVKERGIECFHIVYSSADGDKAVMLDSLEVEDKGFTPGMLVEGIVNWKYAQQPYKGCSGVLERGTVKVCQRK